MADSKVAQPTKAKLSLVLIGAALLVLFLGGLVFERVVGAKTEEVSSGDTTSASTTPTLTKKTTSKNLPSDTLLTALLGTGAALVVVGVLYSRITVIKLPGGAEIDVSHDEAKKVAKKIKKSDLSDAEKKTATTETIKEIRDQKQTLGLLVLPDEQIDNLANSAIKATRRG